MSGSDKRCCIPGCAESGRSHQVLHVFPNPAKERNRFNSWVKAIGGEILGLDNDHIYKYRRVCHAHFEEKHCCRYKRLSKIAEPTLNLPGPLTLPRFVYTQSQRKPMKQVQNISEMPSTSKGPMMKVCLTQENKKNNPEYRAVSIDTLKPDAASTKENWLDQGIMENVPDNKELPIDAGKIDEGKTSEKLWTSVTHITRKGKKAVLLTAAEQKLYRKLVTTRIKLSKCRKNIKKQSAALKAAKRVVTNPEYIKIMENLPAGSRLLTQMQFREHKKKDKGRRFSMNEKILALSIFKQSPKSYKFLRKLLILPAPQTLIKLVGKANITPGINKKIFVQLSKKAQKMKEQERLCVLLFDEMSLKAHVTYNERKDKVVGFVTDGYETKPEFADHAQVFLIRGLLKNFKQPVSYTFSLAATKGPELAKQIKNIVTEIQKTGLIVVATVCDQGSNNRQAIKLLTQETRAIFLQKEETPKENVIIINEQDIVPLYDAPHMLKCIRNNLLTKDLKYVINNENGTAKWSHLELMLKENPGYRGIRLVPKLTENHVQPSKIPKMKVKFASQVFSQAVANNMGYLADKNILPAECKETADLLLFIDQLFDSMNGSYAKKGKHGKPLLGPVTPNSAHHNVWQEAKKTLRNMKFVNRQNGKTEPVPTLHNWAWTLDGIEVLLKNVKTKYGINSVWMRHLNQDPIENFFGSIRSHGCRNNNPTPENFEAAYTTLLINNLSGVHAPGGNCEQDLCDTLHAIVIDITEDCKATQTCNIQVLPNIHLTPMDEKRDPRIVGPLQYVSGYFARESKKKVFKSCHQCKLDVLSTCELEYIKYREYAGRRWLCNPSESMINCISNIQDIFASSLKTNLCINNIKCFIKTLLFMWIDFDFIRCKKHKDQLVDFLINISSRFFIHHHCKNLNKILNGKKDCDDDDDDFQMKAKKHFHKCYKRKK